METPDEPPLGVACGREHRAAEDQVEGFGEELVEPACDELNVEDVLLRCGGLAWCGEHRASKFQMWMVTGDPMYAMSWIQDCWDCLAS